ncbi:MAG: hypothetical protein SFV51_24540 [Bryobacteraceae bacterium]|nr:hypothetical protein [Bryobacteraceae bacterium]
MRRALYSILTASVVVPYALTGQELRPVWTGSDLRVSAPSLRFLSGAVLDRLRNGAAVGFDFQLSLRAGASVLRRSPHRFVFSYDLWEERFSVARLARGTLERKNISHLTQNAAESWCLENLLVLTDGLDPARLLNVHLEVRAEEPRDNSPIAGDSGISLTGLIEIFSRPARPHVARWNLTQGPLRLNDIRQK